MRFFRLLVSAFAVSSLSSTVSAQCATAIGVPNQALTPDADSLTMFVLLGTVTTGNLLTVAGSNNGIAVTTAAVGGATTDGLTAADNICTYRASKSTQARATFNNNAAAGTVAFKAILSSSAVDAIDRITPAKNIRSYDSTVGYKCLAANSDDLFTASDDLGYNYDSLIRTEAGTSLTGAAVVWTSTGIPEAGRTGDTAAKKAAATAENFGEKYYTANTNNVAPTFDSTYAGKSTCQDWTIGTSTFTGSTGKLNAESPGTNTWLQAASSNELACNSGYRLYCISAQPFEAPTPANVAGDPQFSGLQGQTFQVHGMPEEFFNLITTPSFQLNSRFTYLASGNCNYNNTECWTHPGTYVDQLGFMFPGLKIKTIAGPHHKGMRVWINDEEMQKSAGRLVMTTAGGVTSNSTSEVTIIHPHHDVVTVSFPLFSLEITNSDWFFNFNLVFHAPDVLAAGQEMHFIQDSRSSSKVTHTHYQAHQVYPEYPMHGLVGQTWKNARYPSKRMYQGEVDDYMLLDHQLFSTQFIYNLYQ